jgi:uncharacterized repeat protein (TIGR01451 family)
MGRRLLVIVGILLAASSGARIALAQDQGDGHDTAPAAPMPAAAPTPDDIDVQNSIPEDLKLPPAPAEAGEMIDPPASRPPVDDPDHTGKSRPRIVKSTPAKAKGTATASKEAEPPRQMEAGFDDLIRDAKPIGADPLRIRTDPSVVRTQGQAPADGAPAPPLRTEASGPTVDRLPIGKQSVAVTVDVQAPASMNLNQVANLRLIIRNTGTSDALNVDVEDELPEGLHYISSVPEMIKTHESHLSFRIPTLAAGSERTISVKVKPTKTGPFDHAATVKFETGCRSRTRVLEPKLKVDVVSNPTTAKVLKGQPVEFKVTVTNLGDGRARNVAIQAKLSPGLRHDAASKSDDPVLYELTLPELLPGHSEKLDTLVADAIIGGEQHCTVTARSEDVVFMPEDALVTKTIAVVEPRLELHVQGPDQRFTDTIADYEVVLQNAGTAPARRIRVTTTLPTSGRLVGKLPPEARYDATTRRLTWTIDQIEPQSKPLSFPFHVRMGGIGLYEVLANASGDSGLKAGDLKRTNVMGMPDVDVLVSEAKRVVDLGGETTFQILLRNYGTKEATNIQVTAALSPNLEVQRAGGGSKDVSVETTPKKDGVKFSQIPKLGPGKEMILWTTVKVTGVQPKLATCKVVIMHDDLTDTFEDMAGVKVTTARGGAAAEATSKQ